MRVIIAPDSFGGTLTAVAAAEAIAAGWRRVAPNDHLLLRPMSDGGPGFVSVVLEALDAEAVEVDACGPWGEDVRATFALDGTTAYIETAQVCGLHLVAADRRDPTQTTSAGVGQLISAAVARGATKVVVGLGGTCTNDGGSGMLGALGADADGALDAGGGALRRLTWVDVEPARAAVAGVELVSATDVDNPLLGLRGCARNFAPQKGATEAQVTALEAALENFVTLIGAPEGVRNPAAAPGAGAAGGLGYGLAVLGAQRVPGISTVMELVGLPALIAGGDLVITGEGRFDWQSLRGKVPAGVARMAVSVAQPCVVIAGQVAVGRREYAAIGVTAAYSVADMAGGPEKSMAHPTETLSTAAERVARTWAARGGDPRASE